VSAGLPGLGLSGLFVLLSAMATPIFELARRGRCRADRMRVLRIFALSVVMVIAVVGVWNGIILVAKVVAHHSSPRLSAAGSTPIASVPVLVLSLGIILAIVVAAELARHVVKPRFTPTPPPIPFRGTAGRLSGDVRRPSAEPEGQVKSRGSLRGEARRGGGLV